MQHAYILIETEVGQAAEVARRAARQKGVLLVDLVTGPYDVVALVEGPSIAELHAGPFTRIDADLRVTRAVLCPIAHLGERGRHEGDEPEPLVIPEREAILVGIESDWLGPA